MCKELGLALEMRARPERFYRLVYAPAALLRGSNLVQLGEVAGERDQSRLALGAGRCETLQLAQRLRRISAARGIDECLERGLCRVADNRLDIVMGDFASAFRIEREFGDLRARQGLVGAETRHQVAPRLAIDAKSGIGKLGVDERGETTLVAVARQRRCGLVGLE